MRRVLVVTGVVLMVLSAAAPSFAEDLEDYLARAAEADYAGTRVVVTVWEGRSIAEITDVEHSGEVVMMGVADTMILEGKVAKGGETGVAVSTWSTPVVAAKYTVEVDVGLTRLGRAARAVRIMEGGQLRARIVFDLATWAPLVTEIYDAGGELFRIASFTDFDPHPRRVYDPSFVEGHDYELAAHSDDTSLPATAGDYDRVDAYTGGDGIPQAFYSDGLFSFSVFEVGARQVAERFDDATVLRVDETEYLLVVQPTELWVAWERGDDGLVLVGDLPPDHLRRVLQDLPEPRRPNLLERILDLLG